MPTVSIIIATHSRPHLLPRAVESARRAGTDVEIIVVDDASTDETAEVCRNFFGVRYVRAERNRQVAGARNLGLLASSGKYVCFLDDDDVRLPQSLNMQIEALTSAPEAGFVYGQVLFSDQDGAIDGGSQPAVCPQGDIFWKLMAGNFIHCGSALFRRTCLARVGLLHESTPGVDDWDLWVRLAENYRVLAVEQPVVIFRRPTPDSGQGSSDTVKLISLGRDLLRQRWLALPRAMSAPPQKRREVWLSFSQNFSDHLLWEAASSLFKGNLRHASKSVWAALRLHPTGLLGTVRRWARASTFRILLRNGFSPAGLANAKASFKQMQTDRGQIDSSSLTRGVA
ncbi:MAG: glycosyltransferase family 2 protein [Pyrinomonadaceae bacterium]